MTRHDFTSGRVPDGFAWLGEPPLFRFERGLAMTAGARTDFWQRTHYGFRRDDGHCLLAKRSGDFSLETSVEFSPRARYDQCGLMVRLDGENWIKASVEYEDAELSRLGSGTGCDFLIEWSPGGGDWHQTRVAHLHALDEGAEVEIGVYACSPVGDGFQCRFAYVDIGESGWKTPPGDAG